MLNHRNHKVLHKGEEMTDPNDTTMDESHTLLSDIKSIAEIHGRTTGAIRSRLKKEQIID